MLRLACLLLTFSAPPTLCAAANVVATPPVTDPTAAESCGVEPTEPAATTESSPRLSPTNTHWHRLLPGMFR